jgi:hypothetical protein
LASIEPHVSETPAVRPILEACEQNKLLIVGCIAHETRSYETRPAHEKEEMEFFKVLQRISGENHRVSSSENGGQGQSEGIPTLIEDLEKENGGVNVQFCKDRVMNYDPWRKQFKRVLSSPTTELPSTIHCPFTIYKDRKTGCEIKVGDFEEDESQISRWGVLNGNPAVDDGPLSFSSRSSAHSPSIPVSDVLV